MILRSQNGILKVKIDDRCMADIFCYNFGHWDKSPFDDNATAYVIDQAASIPYGPITITIFPGDVFVNK